jgi:hypothetical protein
MVQSEAVVLCFCVCCDQVLVLPGAISLALITSKLHGRDLSLNNAFVPLWIITAYVCA